MPFASGLERRISDCSSNPAESSSIESPRIACAPEPLPRPQLAMEDRLAFRSRSARRLSRPAPPIGHAGSHHHPAPLVRSREQRSGNRLAEDHRRRNECPAAASREVGRRRTLAMGPALIQASRRLPKTAQTIRCCQTRALRATPPGSSSERVVRRLRRHLRTASRVVVRKVTHGHAQVNKKATPSQQGGFTCRERRLIDRCDHMSRSHVAITCSDQSVSPLRVSSAMLAGVFTEGLKDVRRGHSHERPLSVQRH